MKLLSIAMTPTEFDKQLKKNDLPALIVFQGDEDYLSDLAINKISKLNKSDAEGFDFIRYDFRSSNITQIIADSRNISFFGQRRFIIVDFPVFLAGKQPLKKNEEKILDDYLNLPEGNNTLLFNAVNLKLDKRRKIVKSLLKKSLSVNFENPSENYVRVYADNKLKKSGLFIDSDLLDYFLERVSFNLRSIDKELDKLMLYAKTNEITKEAVDQLVPAEIDSTAFDLVKMLNNKQITDSIRLYDQLLDNGQSPIKINALLISQYRLLIQAKFLNLSYQSLASRLKVHPYRAKLALQEVSKRNSSTLVKAFLYLSDIDFKLKSTSLDPKMLFELFISRFI